jgi:hypothetical protein
MARALYWTTISTGSDRNVMQRGIDMMGHAGKVTCMAFLGTTFQLSAGDEYMRL